MKVKKKIVILAILAIIFASTACEGSGSSSTPPPPPPPTPITTFNIQITAPANGDYPDYWGYSTGDFTIDEITWSPDDYYFDNGTVYTVTVSLTVDDGYTFNGLNTALINMNTAIITYNNGTTVTVSYIFPATAVGPTAPQNFTAIPSHDQVTLTWTAPANDYGSEIIEYEVFYTDENHWYGNYWITASSNTNHTFTGLNNATSYTFKVRAVNIAGNGEEATTTVITLQLAEIIAYYWIEQDKLYLIDVLDNGRWDFYYQAWLLYKELNQSITFAPLGTGYSNQRWFINGVEVLESASSPSYTFSSAGKQYGRYTIGLSVRKGDGAFYYAEDTVMVTN